MFIRCSFDKKENKLNYYRGKACIEKLCKKLKEIIDCEEKEMIPLTKEDKKSYKIQEKCHIWKEKFCMNKDDKDYINRKKVKDHCRHYTAKFRGPAHSICNLKHKAPKEIPIIIHNASYDTYFMLNQLAIEFKGELNCIGDNMEKYITFSVPIKKKVINNNGDKKTITYKLKFIDSFRFMSNSLSELVDNTSEIFNSKECKSCIEKLKINSECYYVGLKNDKLIYECKKCKKECKKPINELKESFQVYINFVMTILINLFCY